jgi:hypothetical protein
MRYLYRAIARVQFRSNDPSARLLIPQGKRGQSPRRNVLVVLSRMLNRMLPSFASDDPAFVNGFDARGHVIKGTDEWVSGADPMTGAQASYLKTLCEQAGTPEMFDENLTKAQASKLIDEMREKANV